MTHYVTPPEHVQREEELEDKRKSGFHAPIRPRPRPFKALANRPFEDDHDSYDADLLWSR